MQMLGNLKATRNKYKILNPFPRPKHVLAPLTVEHKTVYPLNS